MDYTLSYTGNYDKAINNQSAADVEMMKDKIELSLVAMQGKFFPFRIIELCKMSVFTNGGFG